MLYKRPVMKNFTFEDYPFHDPNWCVMRHMENKKVFAWIFDKDGRVWMNVKCSPDARYFWRGCFSVGGAGVSFE